MCELIDSKAEELEADRMLEKEWCWAVPRCCSERLKTRLVLSTNNGCQWNLSPTCGSGNIRASGVKVFKCNISQHSRGTPSFAKRVKMKNNFSSRYILVCINVCIDLCVCKNAFRMYIFFVRYLRDNK